MSWSVLLIGSLIGGVMSVITGVATYHLTRMRERIDETRRLQRELFTRLLANRHDLQGEASSQALNAAAVVFAESSRVQQALRAFHDGVTRGRGDSEANGNFVALVRSMIEYLQLDIHDLPDEFILRPFNTRSRSIAPASDRANVVST